MYSRQPRVAGRLAWPHPLRLAEGRAQLQRPADCSGDGQLQHRCVGPDAVRQQSAVPTHDDLYGLYKGTTQLKDTLCYTGNYHNYQHRYKTSRQHKTGRHAWPYPLQLAAGLRSSSCSPLTAQATARFWTKAEGRTTRDSTLGSRHTTTHVDFTTQVTHVTLYSWK